MRGLLALAALAYTGFVIYGSLVPLDFRPLRWSDALAAFAALTLDPGRASRVDWATNVVLAVPMAFFWAGVVWPLRRCVLGCLAAALLVVCGCLAVSIGVEFAQLFFPGRNSSLNDVFAQLIGEAIGIGLWVAWGDRFLALLAGTCRARGRMELSQRALVIYLVVLAGYNVLPLDLSLSPIDLYGKWREGRVVILPFTWRYVSHAQALYELVTDVAIWVPAAFLWRLSSRASATGIWAKTVAAAGMIEFLQFFVMSRVTDSTDIVLAGLGAAIGVWAAGRMSRPSTSARSVPAGSHRFESHALLMSALGIFIWLIVLAVVFWFPFDFDFEPGSIRRRLLVLRQVPLEAYWRGSPLRAITEVLHKTGFMFPLGVLLGAATISLSRWINRGLLHAGALLFAAAVATAVEGVQLALPGKNVDLTDWVLEFAGAAGGYGLYLMVRRRLANPQRISRARSI